MALKLDIAFRNMDPSDLLKEIVEEKAQKLNDVFNGITNCKVVLEPLRKKAQKSNQISVLIELRVPGPPLIVKHGSSQDEHNADMYATVRQAFRIAQRQLQSYVDRNHNAVRDAAPVSALPVEPADDPSMVEDDDFQPESFA